MSKKITALEVLQQDPNWVCFRPDKIPFNPKTGKGAEANDSNTWGTYQQAFNAWQSRPEWYAGIGYELTVEKRIILVDLDNCIDDNGNISDYAIQIIQRINSYTEISVSGKGIHILVYGDNLPSNIGADPKGLVKIEMYYYRRYTTWTGRHLDGMTESIEERSEEVLGLYQEIKAARSAAREPKKQQTPPTPVSAESFYGTAYGMRSLEDECSNLAMAVSGGRNAQLNNSAFALGQLIGGGELKDRGYVERELGAVAQSIGLGEREIAKTMRGAIESGMAKPRSAPEVKLVKYEPTATTHSNGSNGHSEKEEWQFSSYGSSLYSQSSKNTKGLQQPPLSTVIQRLGENEWGDALLFAEVFHGHVVYDASSKEWYQWNEHHWKLDSTGFVRQLVSGHLGAVYMRAAAETNVEWAKIESDIAKLPKESSKIELLRETQSKLNEQMDTLKKRCYALRGAKRNVSVLGFVQTDPRMVVTGNVWDNDKWALPVLNGIVDLRTGDFRDGRPEDYIRTVAPTEWKGINEPCPRFERFLHEIFDDRNEAERIELIGFLQRLLGYAITGLSEEAIFPVLFGKEGRNGKDTLLALIKAILGALSGAVSNDLFIDNKAAKTAGAATPHVCDLQGKRIVWGSETKQGDKMNISQIKQFTGGGDIPARQNYGKQYSFSPTHTLLLMTNYRPHADADDDAFWSRACLIEFKIRFLDVDEVQGPHDRVKEEGLKRRLMDELSGILAWLVRGTLDYRKQGFKQPVSVRMATAAYRKTEDQLQQFIEENCYEADYMFTKARQLYNTYKDWCIDNRLSPMNNNLFGEKIGRRFTKAKRDSGNVYLGIGLATGNTPPPQNPGSTSKCLQGASRNYEHAPGASLDGNLDSDPKSASRVPPGACRTAPRASLDGQKKSKLEALEALSVNYPLMTPREGHELPLSEKCLQCLQEGGINDHLEQPVEPICKHLEAHQSASSNGSEKSALKPLPEQAKLFLEAKKSASSALGVNGDNKDNTDTSQWVEWI
jgi:putative DNA primase/helicase